MPAVTEKGIFGREVSWVSVEVWLLRDGAPSPTDYYVGCIVPCSDAILQGALLDDL